MLHLVGLRYKGKGRDAGGKERETRTVSDAVNILKIGTKFKLHPMKTANIL